MPRARGRVSWAQGTAHAKVLWQECHGIVKEQQGAQCEQSRAEQVRKVMPKWGLGCHHPPSQPHQPTSLTISKEKRDRKAELEATARTSTKGCS